MRTIRLKAYRFNELSNKAKETVLNYIRNNWDLSSHIYQEAHESVKKFHEIFGTKEGDKEWTDVYTSHFDHDIINLHGLRLRTWLINNYFYDMYKGKYYHTANLHKYSKVIFEQTYPLTGVCYDYDLLKPIYDIIQKYDSSYNSSTLEDILLYCFHGLKNTLEKESEYLYSDKAIIETIEANNYEFTKDGVII